MMRPGAKTIKKKKNSTQNKSQTRRAKVYEATSFLSTYFELSTCYHVFIKSNKELEQIAISNR